MKRKETGCAMDKDKDKMEEPASLYGSMIELFSLKIFLLLQNLSTNSLIPP